EERGGHSRSCIRGRKRPEKTRGADQSWEGAGQTRVTRADQERPPVQGFAPGENGQIVGGAPDAGAVESVGGLEAQFQRRNNFTPLDILQYDWRGCDSAPVIRETRSTAEDFL